MLLAQIENAVTPDIPRHIAATAGCKATAIKAQMWSLLKQFPDAQMLLCKQWGCRQPRNVGLDFEHSTMILWLGHDSS